MLPPDGGAGSTGDGVTISLTVGASEGDSLGLSLGDSEGEELGIGLLVFPPDGGAGSTGDGVTISLTVGASEGDSLGLSLGDSEGDSLGLSLGDSDGDELGSDEELPPLGGAGSTGDGVVISLTVGASLGLSLGDSEGDELGAGLRVLPPGLLVGTPVGTGVEASGVGAGPAGGSEQKERCVTAPERERVSLSSTTFAVLISTDCQELSPKRSMPMSFVSRPFPLSNTTVR